MIFPIIDISTENDTMTSKYKIYEESRETPYKYVIKFNRSSINNALHKGNEFALSDFYKMLDKKVNEHHKKQMEIK